MSIIIISKDYSISIQLRGRRVSFQRCERPGIGAQSTAIRPTTTHAVHRNTARLPNSPRTMAARHTAEFCDNQANRGTRAPADPDRTSCARPQRLVLHNPQNLTTERARSHRNEVRGPRHLRDRDPDRRGATPCRATAGCGCRTRRRRQRLPDGPRPQGRPLPASARRHGHRQGLPLDCADIALAEAAPRLAVGRPDQKPQQRPSPKRRPRS